MKKIWIISITIIVLIGCKEATKTQVDQEEAAKEVVAIDQTEESAALYEDLNGNPVALEDFKGKRLLLNYWATWCKPCIEEMPAMARAQEALKEDNYVFLFASDQSVEKIIAFKEKRKFGLDFIKFNGAYADLQITALPVTLIFNEAGEQVERIEGGMVWDAPEMIQKLKKLHQ